MALRCTVDPRGLQANPHNTLLLEAGLPPIHILFKHARLRYALRIACASPTTNSAAAAFPPCFPSTTTWRDPLSGRHAVPYAMTRKWNSSSTRTWGRPPLHSNALASLLMPWSAHTFAMRDRVGLRRPLSRQSLPTKANFNPDQAVPAPPSGRDFLLFSDGSKSRGRVGAAFLHL